MDANKGNSSDNILRRRASIRKCCDQISLSDTPKLSSLMLSLMLETGWQVFLPLRVFRTESRDAIPLRGEGCNTPGVYHQLSNGFELKHDMSSGNQGVKVKSTWWSSNLNLGHAKFLTYGPLLRLCKSNSKHASSMYITSTCIHLDPWKSFMKFGIKKSHEMISHIFAWIALSSDWKHMKSTKPCNLAQTTLIELYNKSYEGFVLSEGGENVRK